MLLLQPQRLSDFVRGTQSAQNLEYLRIYLSNLPHAANYKTLVLVFVIAGFASYPFCTTPLECYQTLDFVFKNENIYFEIFAIMYASPVAK